MKVFLIKKQKNDALNANDQDAATDTDGDTLNTGEDATESAEEEHI